MWKQYLSKHYCIIASKLKSNDTPKSNKYQFPGGVFVYDLPLLPV